MSARAFFNSAFVMFSLVAAACGGGSDATGPSPDPVPSPGPGPDPAPAPSPNSNLGTLEISNPTSVTVWFIKVRACGTTDFGSDLLLDPNDGVGTLLRNSETGHWQLASGCYDVRLSPSNSLILVYAKQIHSNIQIAAGQTTSVVTGDWQPFVSTP